jgi:hypothetical protein
VTGAAHEFFVATASVAGALIGLLFVAISVSPERILGPDASEVHGVRAAATLTAFSNALVVSLFALIPDFDPGSAATGVAIVGLVFVVRALASVSSGLRAHRIRLRDFTFLLFLFAVFVIQLISAVELDQDRTNKGALQTICVLIVVCFLIGIERAWELVGGPRFGLGSLLGGRSQASAKESDPDPDPDDG